MSTAGDKRVDERSEREELISREQLARLTSTERAATSTRHDLLLKVMLWSLGLAVVLGVFAALTASFDVVGRVAATAILTSGVAAILWRLTGTVELRMPVVSRIMDVACAGLFVFGGCGIWSIGDEREMWGTAAALLTAGGLAAGGCWQTQFARFKLAGYVVAGCAGPALLCWLFSIWSNTPSTFRYFFAGVALVAWMAPAALSLVGWTTQDRQYWRWLGVAAACIAFAINIEAIFDTRSSVYHSKLMTVAGSVCVVVMHANLLLMAHMQGGQRWLRVGTIATMIFCAVCVDVIVLGEVSGDGLLIRLTIASAILCSGGTIAVAFIGKRNSSLQLQDSTPLQTTQFTVVVIHCPKCGLQQELPTGESRCGSCGLRFDIQIHEAGAPVTRRVPV